MKIKNIKINSYGNLENKNIELSDNINLIYGKNESGNLHFLNLLQTFFMEHLKTKRVENILIMIDINHGGKRSFQAK